MYQIVSLLLWNSFLTKMHKIFKLEKTSSVTWPKMQKYVIQKSFDGDFPGTAALRIHFPMQETQVPSPRISHIASE